MQYCDNEAETLYSGYRPVHAFVYADPGRYKSTLAASFPKPLLVLAFDPAEKMAPYRRSGWEGPRLGPDPEQDRYVQTEYIMHPEFENQVSVQLEYYVDRTAFAPNVASGWELIQNRMTDLWIEDEQGKWATVVLDSLSTMEYVIRSHYRNKEKVYDKDGKELQDQRHWYRRSAEGIEQVCYALASLNCNVVVLAHVRAERDAQRDEILWTPEAPGTRNRKIPAIFGEIYTIHYDHNPNLDPNKCPCFLQTRPDGKFMATTQIPAPDDCDPNYTALFTNYVPRKRKENIYGRAAEIGSSLSQ